MLSDLGTSMIIVQRTNTGTSVIFVTPFISTRFEVSTVARAAYLKEHLRGEITVQFQLCKYGYKLCKKNKPAE